MSALSGRPRVALLTQVNFWRAGAGHRARILALVRALSSDIELTVVWPLDLPVEEEAALQAAAPGVALHRLSLAPQGAQDDALAALAAFFAARPQHACIFEYLDLHWLRAAVPAGVLSLVDTHDVVSERDAALVAAGVKLNRSVLSAQQERQRLATFHGVLAISLADAEVFQQWLGPSRVLLVPHAHIAPSDAPQMLPMRTPLRRLLFVGSEYAPNVQGLAWFLETVWPTVAAQGASLDVVGGVGPALGLGQGLGLPTSDAVRVHGFVADLQAAYAHADICINPVQIGSGLKVKTVEALAHGRPLVTTSHGARGLQAHAGRAFLVADTPAEFGAALCRLMKQPEEATRLSQAALALTAQALSADACYGPLRQLLLQAAAAR